MNPHSGYPKDEGITFKVQTNHALRDFRYTSAE